MAKHIYIQGLRYGIGIAGLIGACLVATIMWMQTGETLKAVQAVVTGLYGGFFIWKARKAYLSITGEEHMTQHQKR